MYSGGIRARRVEYRSGSTASFVRHPALQQWYVVSFSSCQCGVVRGSTIIPQMSLRASS